VLTVHQNQNGDISTSKTAYTLVQNGNATGRNAPLVAHPSMTMRIRAGCEGGGKGALLQCEKSGTLATGNDQTLFCAYSLQANMIGRKDENGPTGSGVNEEVCFCLTGTDIAAVAAVDCRNHKEIDEVSGTLQAKNNPGYSLNYTNPVRDGYIVRRLTPTECERLMGFPDSYTASGHDGKPISDSKRYSMLGNSIAIPCAVYIMQGIVEQYEKEAQDGSQDKS
jgi:site-specific DNA-cytosine methylase